MPKTTPKIVKQELENAKGEKLSFNMVEVEGGIFTMGLNGQYDKEKPAHEVELDSFFAAEYPVIQELYEFVTGNNPSRFLGNQRPVEQVDWYDAVEFCNSISNISGLDPYYIINKEIKGINNLSEIDEKKWSIEIDKKSKGYRLPTESEWEYAARGGIYWKKGYEYVGSNTLKEVGWYNENSHAETLPVGMKQANHLGLYDMSGNVWEWCWDWYDENYYNKSSPPTTLGVEKGVYRVGRGGSWFVNHLNCRVANRSWDYPDLCDSYQSFRIFRG